MSLKSVLTSRVFSGFLTGVILSLELMNASHQKLSRPVAIIALLKMGIIFLIVTLFTWTDEPEYMAASGLLIIVALIITRVLNHLYVHEIDENY